MSARVARRATLVALLALVGAGCASTSWQGAAADARAAVAARPGDPAALARDGAFALTLDGDPERAASAFRAAVDAAPAGSAAHQDGALGLAALALWDLRVDAYAQVAGAAITAAKTPAVAELLAGATEPLWGRVAGASDAEGAVVQGLRALASHPGAAWEPARAAARRQLVKAAVARGGPEAAAAAGAEAGYALDWRLSAPWGQAPGDDFARPLGPETRPLAAEELSGAGWDLIPTLTWAGRFSDGEVTFYDLAGSEGGVGFAQATVARPAGEGGALVFRLESNRSVALFVAGREVSRTARTGLETPGEDVVAVTPPPGPVDVTVKLSTVDGRGYFRLQVLSRCAGPCGEGAASGALATAIDPRELGMSGPGDAAGAVRELVALALAMARPRRDVAAARGAIRRLRGALGERPLLAQARARLAPIDPHLSGDERTGRAAWEQVVEAQPGNVEAQLALAAIDSADHRDDAALAHLRAAVAAAPGAVDAQAALLDHLAARGWEAEALATAQALMPLLSSGPEVGRRVVRALRVFGRGAEALAVTEQVEALFPSSLRVQRAELLMEAGRYGEAARLYAAAAAAQPERHELARATTQALRAAGELDAAAAVATAFLRARPQDGWGLAERVRVAVQRGDLAAARADIAVTLGLHPDFAPLEALDGWLGEGASARMAALAPAEELVAAYAAAHGLVGGLDASGFPAVTLLSRQVIDVRKDGSYVALTQRVRMIQSKLAADRYGDFRAPNGAELLLVRTIKADGRVLWPERTAGKADLSFTELAPGDAIETAWVERGQVEPDDGGYLTSFLFAGLDAPTLAMDVEIRLAPGLDADARAFHGAPAPGVGADGGGRVLSFHGGPLPVVPREPIAASPRTWLPFWDVLVQRADAPRTDAERWAAIARGQRERVRRATEPGPAVNALATTLRGATPDESARQALAWVVRELDAGQAPGASAEATISERKGSRIVALRALTAALDLDAELVLCGPEPEGPLPDAARPTPQDNRLYYPLVRVGARWLDPERDGAGFGGLAAELAGARCLRVEAPGAEFVTLPPASPPESGLDGFDLDLRLELAASGLAKGTLKLRADGPIGLANGRAWLREEKKRGAIWQQYAARLSASAQLEEERTRGQDAALGPVTVELDLAIPGYAAPAGAGRLVVDRVARPALAIDLAGVPDLEQLIALPARATPLRLFPYRERARVVVVAPAGMVWRSPPPPVQVAVGGVRLSQEVSVSAQELTLTRAIDVPAGRVAPADYPALRAQLEGAVRDLAAGAALSAP